MFVRKKKIKELEKAIETLQEEVENLKKHNNAEIENQNDEENEEYSTVIDEWLNGGKK
jgi:prefoldin subunit 5